jgi:hypothetical protein
VSIDEPPTESVLVVNPSLPLPAVQSIFAGLGWFK